MQVVTARPDNPCMTVAYLIMAHNAPAHLRRLVETLRHPDAAIFVHIDAKADITPFLPLEALGVRLIAERVKVYWGDYSQLGASFALMRAALAAPERFDRLVLLSGADLPLRTGAGLVEFFATHPATEFINLVQMPNDQAGKPESRLTDRWFPATRLGRLAWRLMALGLIARRRDYRPAFDGLVPYAGSQWWALTRACAEHVLDQVAQRPALIRYIKGTTCSDETLVQTLVANSPFAAQAVRALTYTRWGPGAASPDTLGPTDMRDLLKHPVHAPSSVYGTGAIVFARKFNEATSAEAAALVQHAG